jgi:glycine betaine catabolism B
MMSFRFSRSDDPQQNHDFIYKAGQYAIVDPKGRVRSFTIASPTEEGFILISTRIRDTPFKKKLANLTPITQVKIIAPA